MFPTTNVYAADSAGACEFWLCECAWSGGFPNLGVNPMNYQGNMPSGPVGATLGGLTPQAAQIQEVMAMLGNLNEGQLQTVQQCNSICKIVL